MTFDEQDNHTELIMRMVFPSFAELEKAVKKYGAIDGAKSTMGLLEEQLTEI